MANIDIRTINILLDTNIPGKEVVPLKKSVLYQPDLKNTGSWNDVPYFTMDAEYPENFLSGLSYENQMEFFFNKNKMSDILRLRSGEIINQDTVSSLKTESEQSAEKDKQTEVKKQQDQLKTEQSSQLEKIKQETEKSMKDIQAESTIKKTDIETKTISEIEGETVVFDGEYKKDSEPVIKNKSIKTVEDYKRAKLEEIEQGKKQLQGVLTDMKELKTVRDIFAVSGLPVVELAEGPVFKMVTDPIKDTLEICNKPQYFKYNGKPYTERDREVIEPVFKDKDDLDEFLNNYAIHRYATQFFKNLPEDDRLVLWDNYTKSIQETIAKFQSNVLYIGLKDKFDQIIRDIDSLRYIPTDKADIDRMNFLKIDGQEVSKEMIRDQSGMCSLLSEIKTVFVELSKIIDSILLYDPVAKLNTQMDELKKTLQQIESETSNKIKQLGDKKIKDIGSLDESTKKSIDNLQNTSKQMTQVVVVDTEIRRNEIGENNVMIMLRLMFPTKYPAIGNIFSSFHSVVTGKNEFHLKWTDFIPGFLKKKAFEGMSDYSYIKIDGSVYTVTQAIWLNDIYNHKEYGKLIQQFEELRKWKEKEVKQSTTDLMKRRTLFKRTYESEITEYDIKNIRDTLKKIDKLSISPYDRTTDIVGAYEVNINSLVKIMENLVERKGDDKVFIENATKMVESILYLKSNRTFGNWFKPENQGKYDRLVQRMKEDIDKIRIDEYILEKYLTRPGVQLDYEQDRPEYRAVLERKYKVYVGFIENIRKFRAPALESSNFLLQDSINDFLNNTEKYKGVFNFLMNPLNVKKNPFEDLLKKAGLAEMANISLEQSRYHNRLNTGITIRPSASVGQPYYEIYVQLNLIGGELNDNNKSAVDCMYQGESLGDKLARILNEALYSPWTLNNTRVFFDITKGDAKTALDEKIKEDKKNEPIVAKPPQAISGGKNTRKYREHFMKTRKRYW